MQCSEARAFCAAGALFLITGCASVRAMQKPISSADLKVPQICPSAEEQVGFANAAPAQRGTIRDQIVLKCVRAINKHYDLFKIDIQKEGTTTNLVSDVLSLGLTSAAPLVGATSAKRLAGAGAFVIGTRAAVNTDIFYQQTLPAIESAMDARRDNILTTIVDGEKRDPTAEKYDLVAAGLDLSAYEEAGNVYAAISDLTKVANDKAATAKSQLDQSKQGTVFDVGQPILLDAAVVKRMTAVIAKLYSLVDTSSADKSKLDNVAKVLGLPPGPDFDTERTQVIVELDKTLQDPDPNKQASAMSQLEAALIPILGS